MYHRRRESLPPHINLCSGTSYGVDSAADPFGSSRTQGIEGGVHGRVTSNVVVISGISGRGKLASYINICSGNSDGVDSAADPFGGSRTQGVEDPSGTIVDVTGNAVVAGGTTGGDKVT